MSKNHAAVLFRYALGPRFHILQAGLQAWREGDADVMTQIVPMVSCLEASAERCGCLLVAEAAASLQAATPAEFTPRLENLLNALRREMESHGHSRSCLLIVGGDPNLNDILSQSLGSPARKVLQVQSAAEALCCVETDPVVFCILNLFLPDMDGRQLLHELRNTPRAAAVPILVIDELNVKQTVDRAGMLREADGYILPPIEYTDVVRRVHHLLRGAHEVVKEALRDPLTGLPNRAAFLDACAQIAANCATHGESAVIGLAGLTYRTDGELLDESAIHAAVLSHTAMVMSGSLRATDTLARWGTAEFAFLLPGEDLSGGLRAAEKTVAAVTRRALRLEDDTEVHVDMRAGLSLLEPGADLAVALNEAERLRFAALDTPHHAVMIAGDAPRRKAVKHLLFVTPAAGEGKLLESLFKHEGFDPHCVDTPDAALAVLGGRRRFHLVVLDNALGADSIAGILERLRSMPWMKRVPIMLMIDHSSDHAIIAETMAMGFSDYTTKPVNPVTFVRRVRRLLTRGNAVQHPTADSKFLKVLIASPDLPQSIVAATALHNRRGYRVFLAGHREHFLKRHAELAPDIVVLDLALPHESTDCVARGDGAPRVILLAAERGPDARRMEQAGAAGTIVKPVHPRVFAHEIETLLGLQWDPSATRAEDEHLGMEIAQLTGCKHGQTASRT